MTYLDANVIIRLLEGDLVTRQTLSSLLLGRPGGFLTSEMSRLECRCRPLKIADHQLLQLYDNFFGSSDLRLCAIDRAVVDRATQLRAATALRAPDAIHLATALLHQATSFCSGDKHFAAISLIPVEMV